MISPFERGERRQMLELGVSAKTFRLNCAPIVNLFAQTAEPILLDPHCATNTRWCPTSAAAGPLKFLRSPRCKSANPQSGEVVQFEPFYSYRHGSNRVQDAGLLARLAPRLGLRRDDEGTEVFLSLVDLSSRPVRPNVEALTVRTICTNRDLPARLPFGNEAGDFELEGAVPVKRIVALIKPTDALRPPVGKDSMWRLVSQLSLNYLSLVENGREALQEILRLYNFTGSTYSEKQIEGLTAFDSRRHFARVISDDGVVFARGTQVEMEFDEEQFVGGGVYLFASVLEHFLGLYVSMNSFSQLRVRTRQRKEILQTVATASGSENTALARWPIAELLDREPYLFEFFQAIRLLARMEPERQVVGRFQQPRQRSGALRRQSRTWRFPPARFSRWNRDRRWPAGDAGELSWGCRARWECCPAPTANWSMSGFARATPRCGISSTCSTTASSRCFTRLGRSTSFEIPYERGERDRFSHYVLALLGLDTPGLQHRQDVADDSLLFYGGLLCHALPLRHRAAPGVVGLLRRAGGDRAVRGRVVPGGSWNRSVAWAKPAAIRSSWGLARWWAMRPGTSNPACASNSGR